jgi:hypothetical protein
VAANSTAPVHAVSHTSPAIATIYANGTVVGNVMPFVNAIVRPWQILAIGAAAAAVIGFVLFILFYYRVGPLGRLLFRYHDPLAIVRWPNGTASVVKVRRYIPHLWEVADKGHPLDGRIIVDYEDSLARPLDPRIPAFMMVDADSELAASPDLIRFFTHRNEVPYNSLQELLLAYAERRARSWLEMVNSKMAKYPPEKWVRDGQEVPFSELSEKEKKEVERQIDEYNKSVKEQYSKLIEAANADLMRVDAFRKGQPELPGGEPFGPVEQATWLQNLLAQLSEDPGANEILGIRPIGTALNVNRMAKIADTGPRPDRFLAAREAAIEYYKQQSRRDAMRLMMYAMVFVMVIIAGAIGYLIIVHAHG